MRQVSISASLIDRCKAGDKQALGQLYDHYSRYLMSICLHYVRRHDVAQDLLHDSFVVIFTSLDTLRDNSKLESWMAHIVRNTAINYLKRDELAHVLPLGEAADMASESDTANEPPPFSTLVAMIDRLPQGYAQAFKLKVFEGKSHDEIAAMLGISASTSRSQLSRARAMLRAMVGTYWLPCLMIMVAGLGTWLLLRNAPQQSPIGITQPEGITAQTAQHDSLPAQHDNTDRKTTTVPATNKRIIAAITHAAARTDSVPVRAHAEQPTDTITETSTDSLPPVAPAQVKENLAQASSSQNFRAQKSGSTNGWSLALSSGYHHSAGSLPDRSLFTQSDASSGENPYDNFPTEPLSFNREHHHQPFTLSLSAGKRLNNRWSLVTGITYTRLVSDFDKGNAISYNHERQQIHYLGIPLMFSYDFVNKGRWRMYGSMGPTLDIPIKAQKTSRQVMSDNSGTSPGMNTSFRANPQWSVSAALGVQYNISSKLGIFLEPTAGYYFDNDTRTIRAEHPVTVSLPVGLRLNW